MKEPQRVGTVRTFPGRLNVLIYTVRPQDGTECHPYHPDTEYHSMRRGHLPIACLS